MFNYQQWAVNYIHFILTYLWRKLNSTCNMYTADLSDERLCCKYQGFHKILNSIWYLSYTVVACVHTYMYIIYINTLHSKSTSYLRFQFNFFVKWKKKLAFFINNMKLAYSLDINHLFMRPFQKYKHALSEWTCFRLKPTFATGYQDCQQSLHLSLTENERTCMFLLAFWRMFDGVAITTKYR